MIDQRINPLRRKKTRLRYRVAVIGGGSWATAIIKILTDNLEHIHWWVREEEIVEGITKFGHNPLYLSSVYINPADVNISTDIRKVVAHADYVVIVSPSAFIHQTLAPLKKTKLNRKKIINAVKGIIPETMQLITDYLVSEFNVPMSNLSLISGPSHAEEIARERFTYLTAASENKELAEIVAKFFTNRYVKAVTSDDIMGAEVSIVLKNIYALGAGIYSGLGYGDNFIAAYIANCVKEMEKFVTELYPNPNRNISDSVYLGDLLVTAYSSFSRNRLFGNMIGHGLSVRIAQMEMNMIAEGYYACRCIHEINKLYDVYIPIAEAIYGILYEGHNVQTEMKRISEHFV
ncbi:NAD(P)H-dependent glycerol-3-phosphate dehydrogenase [Bacteroidales bacterium OttesenSCG-928-B11]|nr:NAD(P)H-dependent glycerol-3-phosphate dehydrogenase [Bacteroidales bacterium OttesenSCG-928-B11]MDL2326427.1 NAD(P)H-dependent glycerol-3-phosphate dehydrogenase [Bacteroidales bacterium OttesenSCG-928-A14]